MFAAPSSDSRTPQIKPPRVRSLVLVFSALVIDQRREQHKTFGIFLLCCEETSCSDASAHLFAVLGPLGDSGNYNTI